ncbi:hypothetical protein [Microcoleus sp. D2_18a_B4]|uniref:hypothetical protein n=1 Tax=Microcoleus sp. D2_18a_B4 TaxID=3055329 RepID=UPI002FD3EC10
MGLIDYCGFDIRIEKHNNFFNFYVFDGRGALVYGNFHFEEDTGLNTVITWIDNLLGN